MTLEVLTAIGALAAGDGDLRTHLIKCYSENSWATVIRSPGGTEQSRTEASTYQAADILQKCLGKYHPPKPPSDGYTVMDISLGTVMGGGGGNYEGRKQ